MAIVNSYIDLEEFFVRCSSDWRMLSDKEYIAVVKKWRLSFERELISGSVQEGDHAVDGLVSFLPSNFYAFNIPNYRNLPNNLGEKNQYTFAYQVNGLSEMDRILFGSCKVILCDVDFKFTCAFNSEDPSSYPEIFCEEG